MSDQPQKKQISKLDRLQLEREFRAFNANLQKDKADKRMREMRLELEKREDEIAKILTSLKDSYEKIAGSGEISSLNAEQKMQRLKNYVILEKQLEKAITALGLEPVPALGKQIDTALHVVDSTIRKTGVADGTIVKVLETGYRLGERIIRPARVVVVKNK